MRSDRTATHAREHNGRHHNSDRSEDSHTDAGSSEARDAADAPMSDEQLAEILSKRRIRSATASC